MVGKVHPDGVHGGTSAGLDHGFDVQDRDPVLPAHGHPDLLAIPSEGGLVRLATDEDAAGEPVAARGRVGQGVGSISYDLLRQGIDQIEIARPAARGGQELPIRGRDHAVHVNRAVIERLVDHRRVGGHDPAGNKTEGRARILVEARQVDGGIHGIGPRIDHADGVGVLVGDEDAVVLLDRAASRGLRGDKSRPRGDGKGPERRGLQDRASRNVHVSPPRCAFRDDDQMRLVADRAERHSGAPVESMRPLAERRKCVSCWSRPPRDRMHRRFPPDARRGWRQVPEHAGGHNGSLGTSLSCSCVPDVVISRLI